MRALPSLPAITDDPMRALLADALAGNDDLARLILAYFAVLTDDDD